MSDSLPVNEKDIEVLKATFKGNEHLLKTMRALLFGFEITEDQKELVRGTFANPDLAQAVRKKFYPVLDIDVPIGQVTDFWLGTEQQMFGASPDQIAQAYKSKEQLEEMLTGAMNLLADPDGPKVDLSTKIILTLDPLAVKMLSRNLYLKTIETGLHFINLTANQADESPAEVIKKNKKNSTE